MKGFWREVLKMAIKERGVTGENYIWMVTLLLLVISLVGVFALPEGRLRIASIVILIIAGGIEFFNFFIRLPAKKWKQDLDEQRVSYEHMMVEQRNEMMKTIESNDNDRDKTYRRIEKLEQELRRRGWDGKTELS